MKILKYIVWLIPAVALGQAPLQPPSSLQVTRIFGITSTKVLDCGIGCINNQSTQIRANNYHSFYATGSGTWTVNMNYSDSSSTGPWSSFGTASVITNSSPVPIGYGYRYHPYIQFVVTGNAVVTYSASKDYWVPAGSGGTVSFPIEVSQGGTGADNAADALVNLGLGITGVPYGDGIGDFAGASSTIPLQYLRRSLNVVGTAYEFGYPPVLRSADFAFPPQSCTSGLSCSAGGSTGGALTGSSQATLTLNPCPAGVAGTDVAHYLYISGGSGAGDPVLITGGTCTSGAAAGTVVFTPGVSHSGAWTISSATAGFQEAQNFSQGIGTGCVASPISSYAVHATISMTGRICLEGGGQNFGTESVTTSIDYDGTGPAILIYTPGTTTQHAVVKNLRIIAVAPATSDSSALGLRCINCQYAWLEGITVRGFAAGMGMQFTASSGQFGALNEIMHPMIWGNLIGMEFTGLDSFAKDNASIIYGGTIITNSDPTIPVGSIGLHSGVNSDGPVVYGTDLESSETCIKAEGGHMRLIGARTEFCTQAAHVTSTGDRTTFVNHNWQSSTTAASALLDEGTRTQRLGDEDPGSPLLITPARIVLGFWAGQNPIPFQFTQDNTTGAVQDLFRFNQNNQTVAVGSPFYTGFNGNFAQATWSFTDYLYPDQKTFAQLNTGQGGLGPNNGAAYVYCSDCQRTYPCVSGGTGAHAFFFFPAVGHSGWDCSLGGTGGGGGGSGLPVPDSTTIVYGSLDPTKLLKFDVSGVSAATTATISVTRSLRLAGADVTNIFVQPQIITAPASVAYAMALQMASSPTVPGLLITGDTAANSVDTTGGYKAGVTPLDVPAGTLGQFGVAGNVAVVADAYATAGLAKYVVRKAHGSYASLAAIQSGDTIGGFAARGYDGSAWVATDVTGIYSIASENWVHGTNLGTDLYTVITPIGTSTPAITTQFSGKGILPASDNTYDLGANSGPQRYWKAGYINTLYVPTQLVTGAINIGTFSSNTAIVDGSRNATFNNLTVGGTCTGCGGGGGGASQTADLSDLKLSRLDATHAQTAGTCTTAKPCNIGINGTTYTFSDEAGTATNIFTLSGAGSGTIYAYVDASGVRTADTFFSAGTFTIATPTTGWTLTNSGTFTWPTTRHAKLYTFQVTAGALTTTVTDFRAFSSVWEVYSGTGMTGCETGTCAVDVSLFPYVTTGILAPTTTPTKAGDIFVDTVAKKAYIATGNASSGDWTILN